MPSFEAPQSFEFSRAKRPAGGDRIQREREPQIERVVCLSDIHNDLVAARASLKQRDLIGNDGEWKYSVRPVHLLLLGDSVNKQNPNPDALTYFRHLQKTAPADCSVTMLVGNHELDLLTQVANGKEVGLKNKKIEFLGSMDVVCVRGSVLYLHRYPSLGLVRELWQQYCEQGGIPATWNINRRFREAVFMMRKDPEKSKNIFRECDDGGEERSLGGLSPKEYYQKYGVLLSHFLKEMGVTTVIHGHKKQEEGGQKFEPYIPDVLMVNSDVGISRKKNLEHHHRIGSVEVTPATDGGIEIICTYKPNIKLKNNDTTTQTRTID